MKLTDVVDRINGNVDRFTTDLEYYIGGEHFESNELEVTQRGLLKENLGKLGFKFHFAFQDRDVVFMARNPHLRKAGMVRFAGLCSDASYILRSKDESVLSQEYLAVMLQSDHFWDYCESHKVGSVNFANNWSSIANYEFELPSAEKQKEISDKVWAAYRLKESYKKLLAATEEMVKSQFIEMFGSVDDNPKSYDIKKVGDFAECFAGATPSTKISSYWDNGNIPWMSSGEVHKVRVQDTDAKITQQGYDGCSTKMVPIHSIVIALAGQGKTRGTVAINDIELCTNQSLCAIVPNEEVNYEYLFHNLRGRYKELRSMSGDVDGRGGLNLKHIQSIKVIVPPMSEQMKFVSIARQADKSGFELRKSIDAIDAVIKSLINS